MNLGNIHAIETFGLVDGPGVRYVIFMQGCRMRCKYCHNPETWAMTDQAGEVGLQTPNEAFSKAYRYHNYWKDNGGLTISGGEPLLQMDFVTEVFALTKDKGVHTTLDTSGQPYSEDPDWQERFLRLMDVTDLVMLDIKEMDDDRHIQLTGHTNKGILKMADHLSDMGKEMWIRHVLVPGITDDEDSLRSLRAKLDGWSNVSRVEILPYHTLGTFKWDTLGIQYPLDGVRVPTKEEIRRAEDILGITRE